MIVSIQKRTHRRGAEGAEKSEKKIRAVIKCAASPTGAQLIVKRWVKGMAMEIGSASSFLDFDLQISDVNFVIKESP